jgi:hypothetical protein
MTTLLSTTEIATIDSVTERCDNCGVSARMEIILTSGGTLAFCGHHANKHADKLAGLASKIRLESGFQWVGQVPQQ